MQNFPAPAVWSRRPAKSLLLLICGCAVLCGGCFFKKRPAPALGVVILAHPVIPAAIENHLADPPEIAANPVAAVPPLVAPRSAPPRPRVAPAPVKEPVAVEAPPEPVIAPELTDEQMTVAKEAIQHSLSVAEHNLALAQGKALSATQQDLMSKILGFMDSAREAMKNNDWPKARIQASKAEVLSREFAPNP